VPDQSNYLNSISKKNALQRVEARPFWGSLQTKNDGRYSTSVSVKGDFVRAQTVNFPLYDVIGYVGPDEFYPWFPIGRTSTGAYGFNDNSVNRSVLRAYAKLDRCQVQGSVTAAESKETLQMLRLRKLAKLCLKPSRALHDMAKSILQETRRFRKLGKLNKTQSFIDTLNSMWMEGRYGWRPLVGEIAAYRDLLHEGIRRYDESINRVKATEFVERVTPRTTRNVELEQYVAGKRAIISFSIEYDFKYVDRYTTIIYYRTRELKPLLEKAAALGLTIGDIPSHIYETIPLSFVADWFVDIGGWLSAVKPKPGIDVIDTMMIYHRHAELEHFNFYGRVTFVYPPSWSWDEKPDYKVDTLYRDTAPKLSARPTLNPGTLDLFRKLDSLALIWQKIPNLMRKKR
jgi:hypothetical protein